MRRVEVVAALSLAADLGMGRPLEHSLRGCLIATQVADALGLDRPTRDEVFGLSLLRFVGCTDESRV